MPHPTAVAPTASLLTLRAVFDTPLLQNLHPATYSLRLRQQAKIHPLDVAETSRKEVVDGECGEDVIGIVDSRVGLPGRMREDEGPKIGRRRVEGSEAGERHALEGDDGEVADTWEEGEEGCRKEGTLLH